MKKCDVASLIDACVLFGTEFSNNGFFVEVKRKFVSNLIVNNFLREIIIFKKYICNSTYI